MGANYGFKHIETPPSWEVCKVWFGAGWVGFGCLHRSWSVCVGGLVWLILITIIDVALEIQADFTRLSN